MKKILLLVYRDKFTDGLISFLEQKFGYEYEMTVFVNSKPYYEIKNHKVRIFEVESLYEILTIKNEDYLRGFDSIIMSGLFGKIPTGMKISRDVYRKLWIDFWGGDYSSLDLRYGDIWSDCIYYFLNRARKLRLIRKCAGWIVEMEGDYPIIVRWAKTKKIYFVAPIVSPEDVKVREVQPEKISRMDDRIKILLGHSASKYNNHIDAIKRLSKYSHENVEIWCPMSYGGNEKYNNKVISLGKRYFGDRFIPITEFMTRKDYFNLIDNVSIALFNSKFQQGMGNIEEMLRKGKKVYIRKDTPMWQGYASRGQTVYDITDVGFVPFEQFSYRDSNVARKNIVADCIRRERRVVENQWGNMLREISS